MMVFYFYLVCFTFSISYSMLPLHLVYVFQFLHLFFIFFGVLSQALMKHSRKPFVYIYIFTTPWTAAYQAPPFMGFSRQEYWSGLPFPSPGDLLDPGIKPRSPTLQADSLPAKPVTLQQGSSFSYLWIILAQERVAETWHLLTGWGEITLFSLKHYT